MNKWYRGPSKLVGVVVVLMLPSCHSFEVFSSISQSGSANPRSAILHLGGGAYSIVIAGLAYAEVIGPACRRIISSLVLTSRSFCATTQQQQQQPFMQSAPNEPSMWYILRIRVRWMAARIPMRNISKALSIERRLLALVGVLPCMPQAKAKIPQLPLQLSWPSKSVGSFFSARRLSLYIVFP